MELPRNIAQRIFAAAVRAADPADAVRRECPRIRSLAENDSYTFFKEHGGLFITGPTGT
ncbi:MAG: hypothetical protein GYA56_00875, partial [Geobacteraceae bacterium]|nr:hypothetical protein [Geobacteraceae bacterium]